MLLGDPQNPAAGTKTVHYSPQVWLEGADVADLKEGQTVTLINWGNIVITGIDRYLIGGVLCVYCGCIKGVLCVYKPFL